MTSRKKHRAPDPPMPPPLLSVTKSYTDLSFVANPKPKSGKARKNRPPQVEDYYDQKRRIGKSNKSRSTSSLHQSGGRPRRQKREEDDGNDSFRPRRMKHEDGDGFLKASRRSSTRSKSPKSYPAPKPPPSIEDASSSGLSSTASSEPPCSPQLLILASDSGVNSDCSSDAARPSSSSSIGGADSVLFKASQESLNQDVDAVSAKLANPGDDSSRPLPPPPPEFCDQRLGLNRYSVMAI